MHWSCTSRRKSNFTKTTFIDAVIGPQSYHRLPQILDETKKGKVVNIDFVEDKFNFLPSRSAVKRSVSSYLTVQEGCDKFVHFVLFLTLEETSLLDQSMISWMNVKKKSRCERNYFTWSNVNAYSSYVNEKYNLSDLIKEFLKKLLKSSFTTSHPNDMTDDLIKLFGDEKLYFIFIYLFNQVVIKF